MVGFRESNGIVGSGTGGLWEPWLEGYFGRIPYVGIPNSKSLPFLPRTCTSIHLHSPSELPTRVFAICKNLLFAGITDICRVFVYPGTHRDFLVRCTDPGWRCFFSTWLAFSNAICFSQKRLIFFSSVEVLTSFLDQISGNEIFSYQ